jgi:AraC-like DNA-binding protein
MRAVFQKLPSFDNQSFVFRHFRVPKFRIPYHFHPEIELTLILQSRGKRFVGDNISPFREGDLVLLGPNLPHFWCNPHQQRKRQLSEAIVIQFREDVFGSGLFNRPEMQIIQNLLERSRCGIHFTGKTSEQAAKQLRSLTDTNYFERFIGLLSVLELLARSKEFKLLSNPHFKPNLSRDQADRINRVIEHVNKHFSDVIEQTAVARLISMSSVAFSRFFRKKTNRTFSKFVNEVRISEACRMLIDKDHDATEIAYACGFNALSNFNRQFKALKRCTPTEFRKQYQAETNARLLK